MSEQEIIAIAEKADFIVSGYAFTKRDDGLISVLNLEHPDCAMVINDACEMIETNMDEIEQGIVINLAKKNIGFMGEDYAKIQA